MPSATWPIHVDPAHLYFVTTSAVRRAHIFQRDLVKRILVDSLNTGRILGQYELFAFVVMPNHIHFIVRGLNSYTPGDIVRELKKATANLILRQYKVEENQAALAFCESAVKPGQRQQYAIWEDEYQAKNVFSPDFLRQKLDYIHNNPVQPHWHLAERPEDYPWSSARFYLMGQPTLIPLSDARELLASIVGSRTRRERPIAGSRTRRERPIVGSRTRHERPIAGSRTRRERRHWDNRNEVPS